MCCDLIHGRLRPRQRARHLGAGRAGAGRRGAPARPTAGWTGGRRVGGRRGVYVGLLGWASWRARARVVVAAGAVRRGVGRSIFAGAGAWRAISVPRS